MDKDIPSQATCTTCTFAEDFSNYWTAVLYFRARNGSVRRVDQVGNAGFEQAKGGMTIYYTPYYGSKVTVTAFKPVRVFLPLSRRASLSNKKKPAGLPHASREPQLSHCGTGGRQSPTHLYMPAKCHDANRRDKRLPQETLPGRHHGQRAVPHVLGRQEYRQRRPPESRLVPQQWHIRERRSLPGHPPGEDPPGLLRSRLRYAAVQRQRSLARGWQPAVRLEFRRQVSRRGEGRSVFTDDTYGSNPNRYLGTRTGFGHHADYVFGWKGDALQKAMDSNCNINCPQLKTQSIAQGNQCTKAVSVKENIDGCMLPTPSQLL